MEQTATEDLIERDLRLGGKRPGYRVELWWIRWIKLFEFLAKPAGMGGNSGNSSNGYNPGEDGSPVDEDDLPF